MPAFQTTSLTAITPDMTSTKADANSAGTSLASCVPGTFIRHLQ
jgi:hypothetical protein